MTTVTRLLLATGISLARLDAIPADDAKGKGPAIELPKLTPELIEAIGPGSRPLVTADVVPEKAGLWGVEVVRATALSEPEVVARHGGHVSTGMGKIRGGGMVSSATCRQKFAVAELLAGISALGERTLVYSHVESAVGFPLPRPTRPIARGEKVVLVLGADGELVKVMPDTAENGKEIEAISRHVKRRPPAAIAFLKGAAAFTLKVEYHGPYLERHPSVLCTTDRELPGKLPAHWLVEQNLSRLWVFEAIGHLVGAGLLTPESIGAESKRAAPVPPFYTLTLSAKGSDGLTFHLGWGKEAHAKIDALARAMHYEGVFATLLEKLK